MEQPSSVPNPPATERRGLSKGCLVGLIVAGVLLTLIIILAVTCYVKRDDLARWGTKTVVDGLKTELRTNAASGINTEQFVTLADSFLVRLNSGQVPTEKLASLMQVAQNVISDRKFDSAEVVQLSDAMIELFPDLAQFRPSAPAEPARMDSVLDSILPGQETGTE